MIISSSDVKLNILWNEEFYESLSFEEVEEIFSDYKNNLRKLKPKEMISIPNCSAYFCEDNANNEFMCKIYKTSFGKDIWLMLMKDNNEGYALYQNPTTKKYEISWYNRKLEEPLKPEEEEKMITCYIPTHKK